VTARLHLFIALALAVAVSGTFAAAGDFGCAEECAAEMATGECSTGTKSSDASCCSCGCSALLTVSAVEQPTPGDQVQAVEAGRIEEGRSEARGGHLRRVFTPPRG
jgi:hypothetical protein